nr:radical SAM protein [Desulfobacula sp.]
MQIKNNILLINPAISTKTQEKIVTDVIRATFPFSLGHLAGYLLQDKSINLKIVDEQISPLGDGVIQQLIAEMDEPKIIGISTLTPTCSRAYEIADRIKELARDATVIIGGVHASVMPEEGLQHKGVDVVVRGEGEVTFAELIDRIKNGKDYSDIQGISIKKDGSIIHNQNRPLIKDLDLLPPFPYSLFEEHIDKYTGFTSVQTSRGCPYGCIFCSQRSISGRSYRHVSSERAVKDMKTLIEKFDARLIRIMDDNIAANKKRLMGLLNLIIKEGLHKKVSFEAPMRGDNMDEELLDKLKEANFSLLTFGLETASDRLMKLINKGETVDDVVRAIRMTSQKGISIGTTLIFGLPTETNKDRWEAMKLVSSLPLDSVRFNILTPYPGTPIYNELIKENKVLIKEGWENFSVQYMWQGDDLPYVPDGTNKYELMFFTMFANLWFYIRPSGIWKLFTKSVAGGNVVSLKKRWYFSSFLFKMIRVGFYLTKRFAIIFFRMLVRKTLGK